MRARGRLPRCPECDGMARPNVLMFGDASFVPEVRRVQQDRYAAWAASVRGRRLVIVEIGAGTALPAIRRVGEDLVERGLATLIRVNPDADRSDEPAIAIKLRALEALNHISEQLPDRFRSDHSQAALSAGFGANLNESYRDNQTDAVTFVSRDLDDMKWHKMFPSRWRFRLPTGSEAWIEKLDVALTYEALGRGYRLAGPGPLRGSGSRGGSLRTVELRASGSSGGSAKTLRCVIPQPNPPGSALRGARAKSRFCQRAR